MPSDALRVALHIYAEPNTASGAARAPLPEGVLDALRLAAGSADRQQACCRDCGVPPERLTAAARFFVEQVMLTQGAMQRPPAGRADAVAQRSSCGSRRWQRPCSSR
jgi:hypothetical protein